MTGAQPDFLPGRGLRPIEFDTLLRISRAPYVLYFLSGVSAALLLLSGSVRDEVRSVPLAVGDVVGVVAIGIVVFLGVEVWPGALRRYPAVLVGASILLGTVATSVGLTALGPHFGFAAVTYPEPIIFAFALFTVRWAIGAVVLLAAEAGLVYSLQPGWPGALWQWLAIVTATAATSVLTGQLAARMLASATAERAARAELARINASLQERVDEQVAELKRAEQLRRFLAPQVADAVLSGDSGHVLQPHRRRVAVFFCDLRGFTAFAARVEPEDVIEVLQVYYRAAGEQLRSYGATIGSFTGDGVMALLNDPQPCEDLAATAVSMATAVRDRLREEIAQWRRRGYDLGVGIGVALGHATLGVVGFEERQDYTALGTVVNLAARLCAAAEDGQILLDHRTVSDLDGRFATEVVLGLDLKGFPAEMEAFDLVSESAERRRKLS